MSRSGNTGFRFLFKFLQWICPAHLLEEIEGDLMERFDADVRVYGESTAKRKLAWNIIRFFRPGIILRNKFSWQFRQLPIIQNYFKTTYRHISRSKLNFAFKLGGLTVTLFSLLVISIYVYFQLSFDRYHTNFENVYRVNSERNEDGKREKYGIVPSALAPLVQGKYPEVEAQARVMEIYERFIDVRIDNT